MQKEPQTVDAFFAELGQTGATDSRIVRATTELKRDLTDTEGIESRARRIVERMAIVLQSSLLLRYGDADVADLFCASRLEGDGGHTFGTLPPSEKFKPVIERHRPRL